VVVKVVVVMVVVMIMMAVVVVLVVAVVVVMTAFASRVLTHLHTQHLLESRRPGRGEQ
jgi:hypothetical protein